MAAVVLPILWRSRYRAAALAFFAGILLHMLLDSIGGDIMWLAPFNTDLWELVSVPASQPHWIWSFVLHWTFALEAMIWGAAVYFFVRGRA